jgi:hypothetical protein
MAHPFKYLLHFAKFLRWPSIAAVDRSWSLCVDGLWSLECLAQPPQALAAAALYLGVMLVDEREASRLDSPNASGDAVQIPWWYSLGVSDDEISKACESLLKAMAAAISSSRLS